ncbi:hypothetical protein FACS1894166_07970 [Bacilli bacterium]|nr:hypothetical protein FACS1894166_07970 [Bacilli bacterium]
MKSNREFNLNYQLVKEKESMAEVAIQSSQPKVQKSVLISTEEVLKNKRTH